MDIKEFWKDVLEQNADAVKDYFDENAYINWHCTNEHFSVNEFITANCDYHGDWDGEVERIEKINDLFVTVTHVYSKDKTLSFHVTSFIKVINDKIAAVDECWADDGVVLGWRLDKHIRNAVL